MVITAYGKNCFKIQQGELVLVTDPEGFRGRADIIIKTQAPITNNQTPKTDEGFEITYPGEYEVKNVSVKGWPCLPAGRPIANSKSVFLVEMEDFKIVILGNLADEGEIKNVQENLEDADILFIPTAFPKLVRQLKPRLIIPTFDKPQDLKVFLKELGKENFEPQEKLTISKKDLLPEKLIVACLKA